MPDIANTPSRAEDRPPRTARRPVPALGALPRPVYARAEQMRRRARTVAHAHPWVQFSYASAGVLQVRTAQGLFIAPPQWAILIPPQVLHTVANAPHTEIRSLYIDTPALEMAGTECRVIGVSPLLREMIRRFADMPVQYDERGAHGRFVQVMLDQIHAAPRADLQLPWPADAGLQGLCQQVVDHPDEPASMQDWAQRLGVSVRTLGRMFQRQTQLSFRQWYQRARLMAALPLLQAGQSVTEVGLGCGYDSTSAFIAAFRRLFGATPGQLLPATAPSSRPVSGTGSAC